MEQDNNSNYSDPILPKDPGKTPRIVYLLTVLAAVGGFLFGYDTGVISGALLILADLWNLNDLWQELIVSSTTAGAALFSAFGGILNQQFGRKPVILTSSLLFLSGSVVMGLCNSMGILLLGRLTVGAAIGLSSSTIPAYICEAAPSQIRGRLTTVFQLMITLGFFAAGILNACFSYLSDDISWRLMLGIATIPAFVQLCGFAFMPESPRWRAIKGQAEEARHILLKLTTSDEAADRELLQIISDHEEAEKALQNLGGRNAFMTMITTPCFRRALIVGCSLQVFQQLSGINTVAYYTGSIIEMAGISDTTEQMWLTAATYGVNFFCTFIGIYYIEKIGRRPLLLCSSAAVVLALVFLGTAFLVISLTSDRLTFTEFDGNRTYFSCFEHETCDGCSYDESCGYCYNEQNSFTNLSGACVPVNNTDNSGSLYGRCSIAGEDSSGDVILRSPISSWSYGWCPSKFSWLPIVGLALYLCAFCPGMGPLPWTLNAEMHPNWARSTGTACSTSTNWMVNLFVSLTFLSLARAITRQGVFYFYAVLSFVGLVWFYFVVPETKGVSIEQVQGLFEVPWFQRRDNILEKIKFPESQRRPEQYEKIED